MKALISVLILTCAATTEPAIIKEHQYLESKLGEKLVFVGRTVSGEKHGAVLAVSEIYKESRPVGSDPFSRNSMIKAERFRFKDRWLALAELREWPAEYRDEEIVVRGVLIRGPDWPVKVVPKEEWPETGKDLMDLGAIPAETEQEAEIRAANFIIGSYRWHLSGSVERDG